jgi:hypothetical protein
VSIGPAPIKLIAGWGKRSRSYTRNVRCFHSNSICQSPNSIRWRRRRRVYRLDTFGRARDCLRVFGAVARNSTALRRRTYPWPTAVNPQSPHHRREEEPLQSLAMPNCYLECSSVPEPRCRQSDTISRGTHRWRQEAQLAAVSCGLLGLNSLNCLRGALSFPDGRSRVTRCPTEESKLFF